jgi:sodium-dependent dicarboxylate transporter 2/3/5
MSDLQKHSGLLLGILVFALMTWLPEPEGLSQKAWYTAAVTLMMGIWWITEAIPIYATALVPIVFFPMLGITSIADATTPYANPIIYLFMGGFFLALGMERWKLHRRIALSIVSKSGVKPTSIILGFTIASASLSMFVSNTATAIMMLPIAMSVFELAEGAEPGERKNFEIALVLSIAYGCNIGGIGTLIGTPPNALLAGFFQENYGVEISFLDWMLVGVPVLLISLPLMFLLLTRVIYPIRMPELQGGQAFISNELAKMGSMTTQEIRVGIIFLLTALLWIFRPFLDEKIPGMSDAGIAISAAILLFMMPSSDSEQPFLLTWEDTKKMPWGVLVLFGGGLSMAAAISSTGLAVWIGDSLSVLEGWPVLILILIVVAMMIFLTELTSNTASTAAFLPILASLAYGIGENPLLLTVPAVIAASCAFMLPVATPPNAIVYGIGKITIPQMSKAGFWLNILFIGLITLASYTVIAWVFGVEVGVLPDWAG